MTAAEIEADRAAEQRGIKMMLERCPVDGCWMFSRDADRTLRVYGLSSERAFAYWTAGNG
jgi:hypothetical protein